MNLFPNVGLMYVIYLNKCMGLVATRCSQPRLKCCNQHQNSA